MPVWLIFFSLKVVKCRVDSSVNIERALVLALYDKVLQVKIVDGLASRHAAVRIIKLAEILRIIILGQHLIQTVDEVFLQLSFTP